MSERNSTDEKLRESEDRLRLATEGTHLATWDLNLLTREIIYSPRLATLFGWEESKILTHQQMRDQIHPDDIRSVVEKAFEVAMKTSEYNYEARVIHPDHTIHWIKTIGKVIYDVDHRPTRMLGTMMDITDRHEDDLKIGQLAAIVESSDDAILSIDLDGFVTTWNRGAQLLYGYTAAEMLGNSMNIVIPPDRQQEHRDILLKIKNGEPVDHFETRRVTREGKILDVSLTVSPIKDVRGNIVGASKSARDITRQKLAEKLLMENEQRLQIVVAASELGTWELNVKTKEVAYSKRYLEIVGSADQNSLTHVQLLSKLHPDDVNARNQAFEEAYETGSLYYVSRLIWPDESIHWIEARGKVFYDEHNKPERLIGTVRDITEQKTFQQELEEKVRQRTAELHELNEGLVKSNIELGQFAYVASHDLQEPLRKIQTFAARIVETEESGLSQTGKDYLSRMISASARMKQLIVDLLSYSRASSAEKKFEMVSLGSILQTVLDQLKDTIDQKRAVITATGLPVLNVIPYQFEQLLTNLLSNALKFSKKDVAPEITISADVVSGVDLKIAGDNKKYNRIIIKDNGIGFDPQFSDRIFQVFQRLHGKDEYAGTGIGLSIVKKIVENHNGMITTESTLNNGASFTILLPV